MEKYCDFAEWSIEEYLKKIHAGSVVLPKFQRGISWGERQQQRLISSIQRGFPVGAILLAKGLGDQPEKYVIIDGLQRTTSIRTFSENPKNFIGTDDYGYPESWMAVGHWVAQSIGGQPRTDSVVKDFLKDFLKDYEIKGGDQHLFYEAAARLCGLDIAQLLQHPRFSELKQQALQLFKSISEELDISQAKIPVMLYSGPTGLLPEIFERLNKEGLKLTKYQIFAAAWQDSVSCTDEAIRGAIGLYYKGRLEETDLVIEGLDDTGFPEVLTLSDYLTGLSSVLCSQFPLLFAKEWSQHIAYSIACVAHQLPISEMSKLEQKFHRSGDKLDTDPFTKALTAACVEVNNALKGRLGLKLNSVRESFSGHTEFQMASIVTRILVEHYDHMTWTQVDESRKRDKHNKTISRSYLVDRLRDAWGNAGDSQFYRRVWTSDEEGVRPNAVTLQEISDKDLGDSLDFWYLEESKRRDKTRANVNSETKLVLRYFYYGLITVREEVEQEFHLDHLVPIKWWKLFFKRFPNLPSAEGPINSIGNLALMSKEDHDKKKTKLPYAWYLEQKAELGATFENRAKSRYLLTEPPDLNYPEEVGEVDDIPLNDDEKLSLVITALRESSQKRWSKIRTTLLES